MMIQGNGVCLSQGELEEILEQHLQRYGVVIEYGKGLVGIEQNPDSVVSTIAVFSNGQETHVQEKVQSEYLLGTDGARGMPFDSDLVRWLTRLIIHRTQVLHENYLD
jgi:2-polyprenyl-6-methoxyphenol hydroxylase-like FAD-dependent oxidoreductase